MKPVRYIVVIHTDRADNVLVDTFIYYQTAQVYYEQVGTANLDRKVMYDAHNGMKVLHSYDGLRSKQREVSNAQPVSMV
jgi:hypothetical protein